MPKVDESLLVQEMNKINEEIDNFVLERASGTKALRKKFHKEQVEKRNQLVNNYINKFNNYKNTIFEEVSRRAKEIIPLNKKDIYEEQYIKLNNLEKELLYTNKELSNSFKIGFYHLIFSITEDTSFDELNTIIDKIINNFNNMNVSLTVNDFSYTMFTKSYFDVYFETNDTIKRKEVFEKLYWECPKIVLEIKLNFIKLLKVYEKEVSEFEKNRLIELSKENDVDTDHIDEVYSLLRSNYENGIESDEYYLLRDFINSKYNIGDYLRESNTRIKIFDSFIAEKPYNELTPEEKLKYKESTKDLYRTLTYLKQYNKYEPILNDLIEKYKNKDSVKANFTNIVKELDKNDKQREKINKEYLKNCGIGFLAKENETKKNINKVKMNELIDKMITDFDTYNELKISVNLEKEINDASNVHELLNMTLSSYSYLVKMLNEINKEEEKYDINEEIDAFIKFIYNPNGKFTEGLFAFNNLNILDTIHSKYVLLGLSIERERLEKENLDILINDVTYINMVHNMLDNSLSIENIKFLYDYNKIESLGIEELE